MIKLKRVYEIMDESNGYRILVDRLWPRGISKTELKIDEWLKDIAPSEPLRKWYSHDVSKWPEFKQRYFMELSTDKERLIRTIIEKSAAKPVTLVYAAKDEEHNNAVALKEYIENR